MGNPVVFIGVDPGEVTGVAFLDAVRCHHAVELPYVEAMEFVSNLVAATTFRIQIGAEQFVQRRNQRLTEQPAAQRAIGALMALGPVQLIQPATAKKMCTDQRLKDLGWFRRTKDGHINDASRVLFATIAITSPNLMVSLLPST